MGKLAVKVHQWSKITSDPWILESIQAYHLEFRTKPIQIYPLIQHLLSKTECELIKHEIDNLQGAITVAQHSKD